MLWRLAQVKHSLYLSDSYVIGETTSHDTDSDGDHAQGGHLLQLRIGWGWGESRENVWEEPGRIHFLEEICRRQPLLFHTHLWKQTLPAAKVFKWQIQDLLHHNMICSKCFSTAWSFLPVCFVRKEKKISISPFVVRLIGQEWGRAIYFLPSVSRVHTTGNANAITFFFVDTIALWNTKCFEQSPGKLGVASFRKESLLSLFPCKRNMIYKTKIAKHKLK